MKIPLTKEKFAEVDDALYEYINQWKWLTHNTGYASRTSKHIMMHRVIIEYLFGAIPKGLVVDHIDGDKLNNTSRNLRVVSCSRNVQKSRKSSGFKSCYKGVSPHGSGFRSRITVNGRLIRLGTFKTEKEAAIRYNEMALKLFGPLAEVNSI